jgi:uncharacterized protein YjiS (DUF1127 family)
MDRVQPVCKLTWLALAEDHAAPSRSLEQLMALPRSVKVKRIPLVSLAVRVSKLAWRKNKQACLALAENHAAPSRSVEQLMPLRRSVKRKRMPLV